MRVLIADDQPLVRAGVARVLGDAGHDVVAEAESADGLAALVDEVLPDVVIVDVRMPPSHTDDGLRAAMEIRAAHPAMPIVVLSAYVEAHHAIELLAGSAQGGIGYLLKDRVTDLAEFVDAVARVAAGRSVVDPEVITQVAGRRSGPTEQLSPREREVLALMAEGRSNHAIADRLFVTPKTVEAHIAAIFGKLALEPAPDDHRRVLAVLLWLRGRG